MSSMNERVASGTARPNVVWISTHDINPDLGAYAGVWPGAEYADTPALDAFADESAVYEHAFASSPVCAPSRSAIMTGCHPSAIGTLPMRTKAVPPPEVRLVSEYFREAGYYTTCTRFTDFQVQTPPTAFDDCSDDAHWRNRPSADTPFFSAFHSSITHESRLYVSEEEFASATADVPEERRHDPAGAPLPPYYPDTAVFRETWARYADLVTAMDQWVGRILDELEADGLAENTIVVFWTDHGVGLPRAKRWIHEAGLRVPLILRWPGVVAPSRRTELVHTMDLAATMLTVCGLEVPAHMHSKSFLDANGIHLAPNDAVYGARGRIDEQEDASLTVRDHRYRYIRHAHPDRSPMQHSAYPERFATWRELRRLAFEDAKAIARGEPAVHLTEAQRSTYLAGRSAEELYDLLADPHELTNLVEDPAHTVTLARLRLLLDEWQSKYADPWPVPETELLKRWRPEGRMQKTAQVTLTEADGELSVTCETPGASIGWTTQSPGPVREATEVEVLIGSPPVDGRHWHLYSGAFRPEADTIRFGAWRLGFDPSDEVLWERPGAGSRS